MIGLPASNTNTGFLYQFIFISENIWISLIFSCNCNKKPFCFCSKWNRKMNILAYKSIYIFFHNQLWFHTEQLLLFSNLSVGLSTLLVGRWCFDSVSKLLTFKTLTAFHLNSLQMATLKSLYLSNPIFLHNRWIQTPLYKWNHTSVFFWFLPPSS